MMFSDDGSHAEPDSVDAQALTFGVLEVDLRTQLLRICAPPGINALLFNSLLYDDIFGHTAGDTLQAEGRRDGDEFRSRTIEEGSLRLRILRVTNGPQKITYATLQRAALVLWYKLNALPISGWEASFSIRGQEFEQTRIFQDFPA